jgi:hypothetical protein
MRPPIIAFSIFLILSACSGQEEIIRNADCRKYVTLNYSNYDSLKTDPIVLSDVKFNGDCLVLTLRYGGGCKEHLIDLTFIQPECGTPPLPPPTFEIRHNANADACKALITKEYSFDISGIKEAGKNKTDFVINTKNSSGTVHSNTYTYKY